MPRFENQLRKLVATISEPAGKLNEASVSFLVMTIIVVIITIYIFTLVSCTTTATISTLICVSNEEVTLKRIEQKCLKLSVDQD